jgi:hypothetical protein
MPNGLETRRGPHEILWLFLLAFLASTTFAGEVPAPLFWEAEAAFVEQVADRQFDEHLELHLLEYSVDPRWAAEWDARRYSGIGLFGEYGSISSGLLYANSRIAANFFPHERFQLRYEWNAYQDGRFDVSEQRMDALWYPASGWAVVISGWPTHRKEEISGGLGLRIGAPRSADYLVLRVIDERLIWNQKAEDGVRFTRRPLRVVADGNLERGRVRVHGSVDYGLTYQAEEKPSPGDVVSRSVRGFQRFADLALEYPSNGWAVGGRLTLGSLARRQEEAAGPVFDLDRSYGRVVVNGRRELGKWTAYGLAGLVHQRDRFSAPGVPSGSYGMRAGVFGMEGGRRFGKGLEMRVGYLGNFRSEERRGSDAGLLVDREDRVYADKAHVRALYSFRPQMSFELLLSQTVSGSRFGGGSVKAVLVF